MAIRRTVQVYDWSTDALAVIVYCRLQNVTVLFGEQTVLLTMLLEVSSTEILDETSEDPLNEILQEKLTCFPLVTLEMFENFGSEAERKTLYHR